MVIFVRVIALLVGGAGAYWLLRRQSGGQSISVVRLLMVAVLLVATLGFGVCGGVGSVAGLIVNFDSTDTLGRGLASLYLTYGLTGVAISLSLAWLTRFVIGPREPTVNAAPADKQDAP